MKKIAFFAILALFSIGFKNAEAGSCTFVIKPNEEIFKGKERGVKAGDTICIPAGTRSGIGFYEIEGAPGNPVIIRNDGGVAILGNTPGKGAGINLFESKYVRITGTGSGDSYGIKIQNAYMGLNVANPKGGGGYEFDHLDVSTSIGKEKGFAGFLIKENNARGTIEDGVFIHDNYIHDTNGECIYLGQTTSNLSNGVLKEQLFKNVRISNNIAERCGWDGFQIANVYGAEVDHNTIADVGVQTNDPVQRTIFQIGDNSKNIKVHHNIFIGAKQNGIPVFGSGDIEFYENYIENVANEAFFIDNRTVSFQNSPIIIRNNFFKNIGQGFFGIYNENNKIEIKDNVFEGDEKKLSRYSSNAGPSGTKKVEFLENSFGEVESLKLKNFKGEGKYADLGVEQSASKVSVPPPLILPFPVNLPVSSPASIPQNLGRTVFKQGSEVRIVRGVNKLRVRIKPLGRILGFQNSSRSGRVISGPVMSGNIIWWKIDFTKGADGWVAENFLDKS